MSKTIHLETTDAGGMIDEELFRTTLVPVLRRLREISQSTQYLEPEASIHLVLDDQIFETCQTLAKKYKAVDVLIVVGIGGSNLGTLAVQEAVLGRYQNALARPQVFYAETIDPAGLTQLLAVTSQALKAGKKVVLNIVSKSGTTTETVVNTQLLFQALEQQGASLPDSVVVTTDRDSKLWQVAQSLGLDTLEIPASVGGRYSVFSSVGLFPLSLLGVDTAALLRGARTMLGRCLSETLEENPAATSALLLAAHYRAGRTIHDTFCFAPNLEGFGKWYRQLTGESLGKVNDLDGREVHVGITPTVSIGSTDLHSVVQLYLSGPPNTFTTFVSVADDGSLMLPKQSSIEQLVTHVQEKPVAHIMQAIIEGTLFSYRQMHRPFQVLSLPDVSATSLGMLLQMKMVEMMLLGSLLHVNAFDQPAVEIYKSEMRRVLEQE